jgi:hypothetical protein
VRKDHVIRPTRSDALPSQVVCVQASSRRLRAPGVRGGEVEELTRWCAVAIRLEAGREVRRAERSGPDRQSFWQSIDYCLRRGKMCWVFSFRAHRVMTLLGLWDKLLSKEVYLDEVDNRPAPQRAGRPPNRAGGFVVAEDPPTIVQFRRRGRPGVVRWVDTRNYTHPDVSGVQTAGECLVRTVSFVLGMLGAVRGNALGALQSTAAGQAWTGWRRSHYTHAVHVHCHEPALLLERQAYVGGRCECFRIGEVPGPVYHLDFRSHYLSCYESAPIPVSLEWYGSWPGGSGDLSVLDPECTIAEVLIETSGADYPAVRRLRDGRAVEPLKPGEPYPAGRAGSLCVYPVGRFRSVLCGPELAHALKRGRVLRVYRAARHRVAVALGGIAGALRRLRADAERSDCPDLLPWVKLMGVGIVGRLGMHGRRWVAEPETQAREPFASWWSPGAGGVPVRHRSIGWEAQREEVEPHGPETCPAAAAWICSLARVKLLEAIHVAGAGEVYYTDTDSVWTNQGGYDSVGAAGMLGDNTPGLLRIVRVHEDVAFYGYKHYRADERTVCAGRPAEPVGGDERPAGYRVRERCHHSVAGRAAPEVRSVVRPFERAGPYLHGTVLADGRVAPLELWED